MEEGSGKANTDKSNSLVSLKKEKQKTASKE